MNLKISIDDYHPANLELADIFEHYGLKTNVIFFIECNEREKTEQIHELADRGFEIGAHTINHPSDLKQCDNDELEYEIRQCREALRTITGQPIDWMCYPRGRYSQAVIEWVKQAGYKYARTTKLGEVDYNDPYELKTTAHFFQRKEYNGKHWTEIAAESMNRENLHFWGHTKEIIYQKDWDNIKHLCEFLSLMIRNRKPEEVFLSSAI